MNTTTNEAVCKTCGATVPGPRLFCEPCFQAMLSRSDETLPDDARSWSAHKPKHWAQTCMEAGR